MAQKRPYIREAERLASFDNFGGQVIARPVRSLLSARAKMLLIHANRSIQAARPGKFSNGRRPWQSGLAQVEQRASLVTPSPLILIEIERAWPLVQSGAKNQKIGTQ